ncbi:hypothetical protein [Paracoccus pacificus]|uniref:Uncharacterized protein n=1 Tax=Paracoccus pacificus TaxID=1463598 RepID=A0ABW4RCA2_9RHOB
MIRMPQVPACLHALLFTIVSVDNSFAQSLPQPDGYDTLNLAASVAPAPYDFAILGMKPGMPIEEARSIAEQHLGEQLLPVGGTLQVTNPNGKAFRTELRVGYETPGVDFFLRNQSAEPYDSIQIDVSTPATGSIVTAIRREVRVPASDGPDAAALRAQLEGLYGPPSEIPTSLPNPSGMWALDLDYAPIPLPEPYDPSAYSACNRGLPNAGRYEYRLNDQLAGDRKCRAIFTARHEANGDTITMWFKLIDYNLVVQDHDAANAQIDEKLNAAAEPSDMKL